MMGDLMEHDYWVQDDGNPSVDGENVSVNEAKSIYSSFRCKYG